MISRSYSPDNGVNGKLLKGQLVGNKFVKDSSEGIGIRFRSECILENQAIIG